MRRTVDPGCVAVAPFGDTPAYVGNILLGTFRPTAASPRRKARRAHRRGREVAEVQAGDAGPAAPCRRYLSM